MSKATLVKKSAGKPLDDFRAAFSKDFIVPKKIRDGIAQLGADGWLPEVEFMRLCQLSTTDLANYREQFEDFFVLTNGRNPKRMWAGSKATADKMREMLP